MTLPASVQQSGLAAKETEQKRVAAITRLLPAAAMVPRRSPCALWVLWLTGPGRRARVLPYDRAMVMRAKGDLVGALNELAAAITLDSGYARAYLQRPRR